MKNLRIGVKLVGCMSLLLILVCASLGYIAYHQAASSAREQLRENIQLMAGDAAKIVRGQLDYLLLAIETTANRNVMRGMDWERQQPLLVEDIERFGYQQMGVATPDGNAPLHDGGSANISDREYFKQAMAGKSVISEVIIHKILNKPIMVTAAPIKGDTGQVLGVLFAILDATMLSTITDDIKYGSEGYSYIIDGKGTLIAHDNRQFVLDQRNFIEEGRTNPEFARLGQMMQRMNKGETGFDEYEFMGHDRFFGFAPIPGTDWSIAVGAMRDDVMAGVTAMGRAIFWASVGLLVVGIVATLLASGIITRPIVRLMRYAQAVAGGDFQAKSGIAQQDEVGKLNDSIQRMVAALVEKMDEAEEKSRIAAQETEKARQARREAEQARREAEQAKAQGMLQAADRLEDVVAVVSSASEELSAQIEESSHGAEQQSRRVTETATAMEEMNATVLEVAKSAAHAADTADQARKNAVQGAEIVNKVVAGMGEVTKQAQQMKEDMLDLGQKAEGIGQILNVITDIADQTNLLALNAAIEAARAGEAGRGFAVVADEVRKLAEKTMTATKEVGDAIHGIQQGTTKNISNVERTGATIAQAVELSNTSGQALREIVTLVEQAADQVRSIATASEEQSAASEEINRSIEDVQRISSETADAMIQSAKAVSELAAQSNQLQALIGDLKEEGRAA
jgi:methyl-accepting chemotaxis protein